MSTEQRLRELFAADAEAAPSADGLLEATHAKVHGRRTRTAWLSVAACIALVATALALPTLLGRDGRSPTELADPAPTVPAGKAGQPLSDDGASCAFAYSPQEVAVQTDFAFDGTVSDIGPAQSNRGDSGDLGGLAGVTFRVNEWFHGGDQKTVVVDLPAPARSVLGLRLSETSEYGPPEYGVGTRMLVSGAARWGGQDPLASAIAWSCGFTRYYSADDAVAWAAAAG